MAPANQKTKKHSVPAAGGMHPIHAALTEAAPPKVEQAPPQVEQPAPALGNSASAMPAVGGGLKVQQTPPQEEQPAPAGNSASAMPAVGGNLDESQANGIGGSPQPPAPKKARTEAPPCPAVGGSAPPVPTPITSADVINAGRYLQHPPSGMAAPPGISRAQGSKFRGADGEDVAAEAFYSKLVPGCVFALFFPDGPRIWYERMAIWPLRPGQWWVLTPDNDLCIEVVTASDLAGTAEWGYLLPASGSAPPGFRGHFHRFKSYPDTDTLHRLIKQARADSQRMRGVASFAEPTTYVTHVGELTPLQPLFQGGSSTSAADAPPPDQPTLRPLARWDRRRSAAGDGRSAAGDDVTSTASPDCGGVN